ncbi:Phytochelatin synthase-domain-containing protein [Cokeromyces recurvatus]|uniref:Phytochelatin synthase-domain-containing protein n=1 Tax=Cokeromyces recurvatus TaxID=90255 RepID=UPI002220E2E6|nr:Phytochelatin synthase-domain-containing protein [Cokeromyces recurvatus]KAI7905476.1 Phytochelatin synthase-domain-containing protein [Cokeromyces recurvatus]
MASRTLLSKTGLKSSFSQIAIKKNNMLNSNRITIFPSSQASRQATTTTVLDNSITQGRLPYNGVFTYTNTNKEVNLVKFTSVEGKRLFRNAMVQGYAESFFKLMGNFSTQSSPYHGGVSSLAMVLNALEIDPKRIWKGNWRWFSSEQMKTCSPEKSIKEHGIPFDEFTCIAQTHCKVQPKRGVSYEQFISDLKLVTSDTISQMVVNYSRLALGQLDPLAHFSPIGGYNKDENQVLIMDVARGKYPSIWVNAKDLYRAMMDFHEQESGLSRGYFILSNYEQATQQPKGNLSISLPKLKCKDCSRNCHNSLS